MPPAMATDLAIHLHHELLVEQVGARFDVSWRKNGFGCVCAGAKLVVAPLQHVNRARRKARAGDGPTQQPTAREQHDAAAGWLAGGSAKILIPRSPRLRSAAPQGRHA